MVISNFTFFLFLVAFVLLIVFVIMEANKLLDILSGFWQNHKDRMEARRRNGRR